MGFAIGLLLIVGAFYLFGSKVKGELKKNAIKTKLEEQEIGREIEELEKQLGDNDE